jgi:hypothetical protein
VRLISLQNGPGQEQIVSVAFAASIEQLGDEFDAGPDVFLDTAAVMHSLDLVISVDISVARLAGALNRPVYILLKRLGALGAWLHAREDSLWYPSARLYRQHTPGGWTELLARVARDVRQEAKSRLAGEPGLRAPLVPISAGKLWQPAPKHCPWEMARLHSCARLKVVNETLWTIEDEIRDCERRQDFAPASWHWRGPSTPATIGGRVPRPTSIGSAVQL